MMTSLSPIVAVPATVITRPNAWPVPKETKPSRQRRDNKSHNSCSMATALQPESSLGWRPCRATRQRTTSALEVSLIPIGSSLPLIASSNWLKWQKQKEISYSGFGIKYWIFLLTPSKVNEKLSNYSPSPKIF